MAGVSSELDGVSRRGANLRQPEKLSMAALPFKGPLPTLLGKGRRQNQFPIADNDLEATSTTAAAAFRLGR